MERFSYEAFTERVHPDDRERVGPIVTQALKDSRAIRMYRTTQDVTETGR